VAFACCHHQARTPILHTQISRCASLRRINKVAAQRHTQLCTNYPLIDALLLPTCMSSPVTSMWPHTAAPINAVPSELVHPEPSVFSESEMCGDLQRDGGSHHCSSHLESQLPPLSPAKFPVRMYTHVVQSASYGERVHQQPRNSIVLALLRGPQQRVVLQQLLRHLVLMFDGSQANVNAVCVCNCI
jgi:hypothetical protein